MLIRTEDHNGTCNIRYETKCQKHSFALSSCVLLYHLQTMADYRTSLLSTLIHMALCHVTWESCDITNSVKLVCKW